MGLPAGPGVQVPQEGTRAKGSLWPPGAVDVAVVRQWPLFGLDMLHLLPQATW